MYDLSRECRDGWIPVSDNGPEWQECANTGHSGTAWRQARPGVSNFAMPWSNSDRLVRHPSRRLRAIPKDNLLGQIDEGAQARGHVAASRIVEAISGKRGRPFA